MYVCFLYATQVASLHWYWDIIVHYFALVICKFDYSFIMWNPIYSCNANLIETIQRRFLRFLFFSNLWNHYPSFSISYEILLQIFPSLLSLVADKLTHLITYVIYAPLQSLHSKNIFHLPVAKTNIQFYYPIYNMYISKILVTLIWFYEINFIHSLNVPKSCLISKFDYVYNFPSMNSWYCKKNVIFINIIIFLWVFLQLPYEDSKLEFLEIDQ